MERVRVIFPATNRVKYLSPSTGLNKRMQKIQGFVPMAEPEVFIEMTQEEAERFKIPKEFIVDTDNVTVITATLEYDTPDHVDYSPPVKPKKKKKKKKKVMKKVKPEIKSEENAY